MPPPPQGQTQPWPVSPRWLIGPARSPTGRTCPAGGAGGLQRARPQPSLSRGRWGAGGPWSQDPARPMGGPRERRRCRSTSSAQHQNLRCRSWAQPTVSLVPRQHPTVPAPRPPTVPALRPPTGPARQPPTVPALRPPTGPPSPTTRATEAQQPQPFTLLLNHSPSTNPNPPTNQNPPTSQNKATTTTHPFRPSSPWPATPPHHPPTSPNPLPLTVSPPP